MPITVSGTSITFNDSTTQTTAFTGGGGVTSINGQSGAVTTTSPVWFSARSATPATSFSWDRTAVFTFADAGPELLGDGTLQIGVTASAVFATNAPTWDVNIVGYEY